MNIKHKYSTWVEIDLKAVKHNVRSMQARTKTPVMAIVKADAYGHGAVPVAKAVIEAGATWCAVARADEALQLRNAGIECPILLLGYTPSGRIEEMIHHQVSMTVWNIDQVEWISECAQSVGKTANLHVKIDTGMSRIGVQAHHALKLVQKMLSLANVQMEGTFTHFARADETDLHPTDEQIALFEKVLAQFKTAGIPRPMVHAANSAAGLKLPSAYFDLIRFGIAMYGLHPSSTCPNPLDFQPALSWKTVLSNVKVLPPGRGISYGHEYHTKDKERIGTIPVGYADGLRRLEGNHFLVQGKKVPAVGRVCMDQTMLQLDTVPHAKVGDEVVLIGKQGQNTVTTEEVAERWGTINYEVVCALGSRVPRIYI